MELRLEGVLVNKIVQVIVLSTYKSTFQLMLLVSVSVCLSASTDSCKKTAVVFDEAIASFDVINCQSVQAQVCVST